MCVCVCVREWVGGWVGALQCRLRKLGQQVISHRGGRFISHASCTPRRDGRASAQGPHTTRTGQPGRGRGQGIGLGQSRAVWEGLAGWVVTTSPIVGHTTIISYTPPHQGWTPQPSYHTLHTMHHTQKHQTTAQGDIESCLKRV